MANTKEQTLAQIASAWQQFQEVLKSVPPQRMDEPGLEGQWSVKDIIGHITTWETEMLRVVQRYVDTRDPAVLAYENVDPFNERAVSEKRVRLLSDLLDELHQPTR